MRALKFAGTGKPPEIVEVDKPEPGPGQVVIKIGGAGVCHSDLHIMDEGLGFEPGFTLGHENAGWISDLGDGVKGFKEGDGVAVYGPWGCGRCHKCQVSAENYCENWEALGGFGGGLGFDGGMAEYMLIPDPRLLVPLEGLDPARAAPLSDAALTPYHAIMRSHNKLTADDTVVIIGVGGLGHMAVQLMRQIAPVHIIACDVDEKKLEHAKSIGADETVNNSNIDEAAEKIRKVTGPRGAELVLDCVGVQPTLDLGQRLLGRNSSWTIVGLGGGHHDFHHGSTPYGVAMSIPYWGSRIELMEVIAMEREGRIKVETAQFPLEQGPEVYDKLREGEITGRAVLVP